MVELVAARIFFGPLANSIEHVTLNLNTLISDGWVVESAQHVVY